MGFSNIKCPNITKIGCEYFIDRFFCPEHCEGFNDKEEIIEDIEIVENKIDKKRR